MGLRDGAWISGATLVAGKDVFGNTQPLNCDPLGTLNVNAEIEGNPATDGNVTTVLVGTMSTLLLPTNSQRKGVVIQSKDQPLYIILSSADATTSNYSYYLLKLNVLNLGNHYIGPISAVVNNGTASVQVTEQI